MWFEDEDEFEDDEEEESAPPALTDADLEEIARIVEGRTETTLLSDVMLQIFEIEQGERAYEPTEQMLVEHLRHDPRFAWLGAGRFRPVGFVPENVLAVPEALVIPEYDFATIEGERFDLEMEVAGLESKLAKEVHALLVQDVGDEDEPERPAKHPDQASCVLMYHHKQQGTFPLAQIPEGLFSAEPPVQEIVLGDGDSQFPAWVNLSTRLVYGLGDFYTRHDMPISGGIFRIHATRHADRFDLEYSGETDETASVPPGRLLELLQLKEEADGERLPTYEVMCRMLERQTGGMSFAGASAELRASITDTIGAAAFYDAGYVGIDELFGGTGRWHAGAGLGLLVSQLNNYTLAPIDEERISEAAGVNSASGSFGLSFGLAVAGGVLLATMSLAFTNMTNASPVIPSSQQQQIAQTMEDDAQVVSNTQLEQPVATEPPAVQAEILRINTDATNLALQAIGVQQQFGYGHLLHTLATNVRYEPDEFNFMKERRVGGVTAAQGGMQEIRDEINEIRNDLPPEASAFYSRPPKPRRCVRE